ncbi:hypothetical protein [Corynebacterium propinquum]
MSGRDYTVYLAEVNHGVYDDDCSVCCLEPCECGARDPDFEYESWAGK